MNKEAMKQQIQEALSKKLGDDFHITIQKVFKPNMELDALVIWRKNYEISPTIYLEPFYEALTEGSSIDNAINGILQIYQLSQTEAAVFDIKRLTDFDYAKDRLFVQLVNRHLNQKLLEHAPHAMFLDDYAIIARCAVETAEDCNASFLVQNYHLNIWQTDSETVLSTAISNTLAEHNVELMPLEQLIRETFPAFPTEHSDCNMWFMSNSKRYFGAAAVLSDDVLKSFAKEHGSFYIIFSSVHEVLLIPSDDASDLDTLTRQNQNVNATALEENDILGTKAYFYQRDRGFVL